MRILRITTTRVSENAGCGGGILPWQHVEAADLYPVITAMKPIQRPTPEENEAINKAIASDPDTFDPANGFDHLVRVDPKKLSRPKQSEHQSQIAS